MNLQQMQQAMGTQQPQSSGVSFTPETMNQVMNTGQITPDQHATALGHSTGMISDLLSGGWGALQDVSTGFAKGGTQTFLGLGSLGQQTEQAIGGAIGLTPQQSGSEGIFNPQSQVGQQAQQVVQPQGIGQTIGKVGEQVGEFFLPTGAEKATLAKGASYIDKLPDIMGLTGKAAKAVTATLKTALHSITSGASFGGITAAQTGDLSKAKGAGELGLFSGGASGVLDTFGKGMGEAFQKADFKLSPMQEAKAASKVDSAAQFMTKNGILGSDSTKYAKLTQLNSSLESALQSSLPNTVGFSKSEIEKNIMTSVEKLREDDPAIYASAKADADKAIKLLREAGGNQDILDAQQVLKSKRSYGQAAFKQSKFSVRDPNVVSEGSYAVEQGFQKTLEDTLSRSNATIKVPATLSKYFDGANEVSLQDFNKVYSDAISSKSLTGMARFKNDSGLLGRFFGLWVGETVGQAVVPGLGGKIGGATIGEMASQKLPGLVRNIGERAASTPMLPENISRAVQGVENQ